MQSSIDDTETFSRLVESTQDQTKALELTIKEIQHQTIVTAYSNGGIFDIGFSESCGKGTTQLEPGGEMIPFLSATPIMINEKGAYSITPFRIFMDYTFLGTSAELDYKYRSIERNLKINDPLIYHPSKSYPLPEHSFNYHPSAPLPLPSLLLNNIFEKAQDENFTEIKIELDYSFRPFSPDKQSPGWIADQNNEQTKILAKWRYDELNDKWNVLDLRNSEPEIICK